MDSGLGEEVVILKVPGLPGNRLVFASTGPVNRDYDDVRRFSDAAANGIKRSADRCFSPLWCLIVLVYLQSLCLFYSYVCPFFQGLESRHAAPPAGLPSTQGLQEQHCGGCTRRPSCSLHGEIITHAGCGYCKTSVATGQF